MESREQPRGLSGRRNLVPLPYRRVSAQAYDGAMTERAIRDHLLGREAYRRTDFVVLHDANWACAVVAIERSPVEHAGDAAAALFSKIVAVNVLALPTQCRFVRDAAVDVGNRSALAAAARRSAVGSADTLVVWGKYDHLNFIHRPQPAVVRVVEVVPPNPAKLLGLAEQVLSYADLPPLWLKPEIIDVRALCQARSADAYLLPCRSGALDDLTAPLYFLDERPARRRDWVLVGCERSLQFYRHYYAEEPPAFIDICPRRLMGARKERTLVKCCMLEFDIEEDGPSVVVPWGANLAMVEQALRQLSREVDYYV